MDLVLIGAIGYVGYRLAISGSLGSTAQQIVTGQPVTSGGTPRTTGGATGGTTGGQAGGNRCAPVGPPLPPFGSCQNAIGDGRVMAGQNPNFWQQMFDWQAARSHAGEDPNDWTTFRIHERNLCAPDPGSDPPIEFCVGSSPTG